MKTRKTYEEPLVLVLEVRGETIICASYSKNGVAKGNVIDSDDLDWE